MCTVAQVQHPAPKFTGTAVVDGDFKQISLDDYKVSTIDLGDQ